MPSDRYIDFANSDMGRRLVDAAVASRLTDSLYSFGSDMPGASTWVANQGPRLKAVVFDASQILRTEQLKQLRDFFQPLLRNLDHCAHVVILARAPATVEDPLAASTQQAIEGFSRSLAKEMRNGATVKLLQVDEDAQDQLEPRSSPVSSCT